MRFVHILSPGSSLAALSHWSIVHHDMVSWCADFGRDIREPSAVWHYMRQPHFDPLCMIPSALFEGVHRWGNLLAKTGSPRD